MDLDATVAQEIEHVLGRREKSDDQIVDAKEAMPENGVGRDFLNTLFKEYYEQTGLPCALVKWEPGNAKEQEGGRFLWWSSSGKQQCRLCFLVRNLGNDAFSDCMECDTAVAALAQKASTGILHRCHCGICEIAIPLTRADGNKSAADLTFITGQMKAPSNSNENLEKLLELDATALRIARRVTLRSHEHSLAGCMESARLKLLGYAEEMATFGYSQVSRILLFILRDLLPALNSQDARKLGIGGNYSFDHQGFRKLVDVRIRMAAADTLLDRRNQRRILSEMADGSPLPKMFHSLTKLGESSALHACSTDAGFPAPHSVVFLKDKLADVYREKCDEYLTSLNGKPSITHNVLYPWLKHARKERANSAFYASAVAIGRSPNSGSVARQVVELKVDQDLDSSCALAHRWAEELERKTQKEMQHIWAGASRTNSVLEALGGADAINDDSLRQALNAMLSLEVHNEEELGLTALLEAMIAHKPRERSALLRSYAEEHHTASV